MIAPLLRRISGFYLFPLAGFLVPFVSLPFLSRWASEAEWAALMTGYSLGGLASLAIYLGFPLTGPQQVAALAVPEAVRAYWESRTLRRLAFTLALLPLALASWLITPAGEFASTYGMALSAAVLGLSGNWLSVGLGRPAWVAQFEVLPRITGAVLGIVLVALGGGVAVYAAVQFGAALVGFFLMDRRVDRLATTERHRLRLRDAFMLIAQRLRPMAAEFLMGVYRVAPVSLVAVVSPSATVGVYAAGDRLFRMSLFAVIALANGLIPWVIRQEQAWDSRRAARALYVHAAVGAAGAALFAVVGPGFSEVFFGVDYRMSRAVALCFGLAFLAVSIETALIRFYLLATQRTTAVLVASATGALVAALLLLSLPQFYGVTGAAVGVLAVEVLQVLMLTVASLQTVSRRPRRAR